jgi:hypothetical protein
MRFGRLVVVAEFQGKKGAFAPLCLCRCDCGDEHWVTRGNLRRTRSCGCLRVPELVGARFGRLTVVEPVSTTLRSGRKQTAFRCRCDCGKETVVYAGSLRANSTVSCGCVRSAVIHPGTRFGRLVVGERLPDPSRRWAYVYHCTCDCGMTNQVKGSVLRSGKTLSCGCLRDDVSRGPYGESVKTNIFHGYRKNARKRGIQFDLTLEDAVRLFQALCHYCGAPPRPLRRKGLYGEYVANGIDRPDNNNGYVRGNMVPCCTTCNLAKSTMTVAGFLRWVSRIVPPEEWRVSGGSDLPIFAPVTPRERARVRKYLQGAKERGFDFELDEFACVARFRSPCSYCGRSPALGIDRADNTGGYTEANAVP